MTDNWRPRKILENPHWWACALMMMALPWSRFLTTTALFLLAVSTLVGHFSKNSHGAAPLLFKTWARGLANTPWWTLLCFVVPVFISGLWSDDVPAWLDRLKLRLPYLVLPLVFLPVASFKVDSWYKLLYILFIACVISMAMVLTRYAIHFEDYTHAMGRGHAVRTPISHIRYSLVMVIGFVSGVLVLLNRNSHTWPAGRWWQLGSLCFLFAGIQILAVRSGWVALYVSLLMLTFFAVQRTKKVWLVPVVVAVMLGSAWAASVYVPSVRTKIGYVRWDYLQHQQGIGADYADSDRWVSQKVGWDIARQHFWWGTGAGDLQQTVADQYKRIHPERTHVLVPHNMYIYAWASTGIFGFISLVIGLLAPFFYRSLRQEPLMWITTAVVSLSMLVEPYLENSAAVSLHAFFVSLCLIKPRLTGTQPAV